MLEKENTIFQLKESIQLYGLQKEKLFEESKAQLNVIENQKLKLTQMEVDRDKDVIFNGSLKLEIPTT